MDSTPFARLAPMARHAHWLIRIPLIATFLFHGLGKWTGPGGVAAFSTAMDLALPLAYNVAIFEVVAPILLLFGGFPGKWSDLMTRIGGILIVPVMAGAIVKVHLANGFNSIGALGYEFQMGLMFAGLFFVLRGAPETQKA